jgi:hypothetical protein
LGEATLNFGHKKSLLADDQEALRENLFLSMAKNKPNERLGYTCWHN